MRRRALLGVVAGGLVALGACAVGARGVRAAGAPGASGVLYTVRLGTNPLAVAIDAHTARAFVAGSNNTVSVLDARSGTVVRTILVGRNPAALAVDAATGRTFVANSSSDSVSVLTASL